MGDALLKCSTPINAFNDARTKQRLHLVAPSPFLGRLSTSQNTCKLTPLEAHRLANSAKGKFGRNSIHGMYHLSYSSINKV